MIFLGFTVLTEDPNRREEPTHTVRRSKARMDSVTGAFTELDHGTVQVQSRPFSWFMPDRPSIETFRAFRTERLGRLVPFWIPTWHHDMNLVADGLAASGTLTIENINYARHQFAPPQTWRRYLAFIRLGAGIQFIKRIDAAAEGTTTETITLDSATGVEVKVGEWMLSFLTLVRLGSDTIPLHWHSPTLAEATLDVVELPHEMLPV